MHKPLVSIAMITFNHSLYIAQAIDGVIQQKTTFSFELLIGEDCSNDGTREIVFEYQKKYPNIIQVITSEQNVGMKKNNYRTIKACRGKYIAFCEGDDYWHHTDKLEQQVNYLENHQDCGLVYSGYDVQHFKNRIKISDFIKYRKRIIPESPRLSDIIEGRGGILTCTVVARRNTIIKIIESDPYIHQSDQFLMGDIQLWAEMSTISTLHYIPISYATHIITDESVTRSKDIKKRLLFGMSNSKVLIYLCNKYNLPLIIRKKHEDKLYDFTLKLALYTRNAELAEKIRKDKMLFSFMDWVRYYGAKYTIVYYVYKVAALLRSILHKDNDEWR
jgi:glycosyltransferase involved in cell wall biosynthesis